VNWAVPCALLVCALAYGLPAAVQDKSTQSERDVASKGAQVTAPLTTEQQRALKADRKQRAREEKEARKHPPEVLINAPAERVANALIAEMARNNWQVQDDSKHSLVFTQQLAGTVGALMQAASGTGSERLKRIMRFVLSEQGDKTDVIVTEAVTTRSAFGLVSGNDITQRKNIWHELEGLLYRLKGQVERH